MSRLRLTWPEALRRLGGHGSLEAHEQIDNLELRGDAGELAACFRAAIDEMVRLRAEVEALRKGPSVEEVENALLDAEDTYGHTLPFVTRRVLQMREPFAHLTLSEGFRAHAARVILRALGREA